MINEDISMVFSYIYPNLALLSLIHCLARFLNLDPLLSMHGYLCLFSFENILLGAGIKDFRFCFLKSRALGYVGYSLLALYQSQVFLDFHFYFPSIFFKHFIHIKGRGELEEK